ncbi:MAG: acetyl ornithine aminotransferase family protein [Planctomycetota bacterium]
MLGIRAKEVGIAMDEQWIGPAPWIETPLPGPKAQSFIGRDQSITSPSYTRDYPLVVRRGVGSVLEDVDGNRFLDFTAGIAVCATGHCHPKVVAAIERQARSLIHICGADFYYPPMVELVEKLAALLPGEGHNRVFLTNSGTEATEAAMKLARFHSGRKYLIAFYGAFHGRSLGALSLTASKARQRKGFGPLVPMTAHVPYGDAAAIENTLFRYQMDPSEVAAIFVEPIQGEGGYVIPPADFLPQLRALCDKHGILLVFDEIQTGMGRTGKWFAFEHLGALPDIVLMAKGIASGLPLGAMICRSEIMNWPPGAHASTFGGNPIACAAALATLELVETVYMANAANLGEVLGGGLQQIAKKHPTIQNPRGLGLLRAVDIVNRRTGKADPKLRERILQESFNRGLLLLGCGETSIRFIPPLCINEAQLEAGLRLFDEAVATVA